ncbi:MAG: NUDIX hydrolase [Acidobacteriota bacterium]
MSEAVFEGKHVLLMERDGWEFVERKRGKSAVAIIARTDEGSLVLTEQYRRAVDARVIDLPAGLVGDENPDEDPGETARRELHEETGFACEDIELVMGGPSSPGITSEIVELYRATGLTRRGHGGGVDGEDITVHEVPLNGIEQWLRRKQEDGVLIDLKVWSGLYFVSR